MEKRITLIKQEINLYGIISLIDSRINFNKIRHHERFHPRTTRLEELELLKELILRDFKEKEEENGT